MIRLIVILWLFVPVLILVWHFGPGQQLMMEDQAGRQIRLANQHEGKEDWPAAAKAYSAARQQLPDYSTELRRRLQIAEAAALNRSGRLDAGRALLNDVVMEMEADPRIDAVERNRTQHELAAVSYYSAWQMRLAGRPAEEWRPIADLACDQLRSLSKDARRQVAMGTGNRSTDAQRDLRVFRRNLEAVVKMQYMHVTDLQKKELPEIYVPKTDLSTNRSTPENRSADHSHPEKEARPEKENGAKATAEETTNEKTEEKTDETTDKNTDEKTDEKTEKSTEELEEIKEQI